MISKDDLAWVARIAAAADAAATRGVRRRRRRLLPSDGSCAVLRGLVRCGVCERKMQGQWTKDRAYYRCRYPREYALANSVDHPRNVFLAEAAVLPALDSWLSQLFLPERVEDTVTAMWAAQPDSSASPASASHAAIIEECDAKLATYRAALEAGTDPALVSSWIAEIQTRRAAAARAVERTVEKPKLTKNDVRELVSAATDIHTTLARAQPAARAEVYQQLGLKLVYQHEHALVRAEMEIDPAVGVMVCVRGGTRTRVRGNPAAGRGSCGEPCQSAAKRASACRRYRTGSTPGSASLGHVVSS